MTTHRTPKLALGPSPWLPALPLAGCAPAPGPSGSPSGADPQGPYRVAVFLNTDTQQDHTYNISPTAAGFPASNSRRKAQDDP